MRKLSIGIMGCAEIARRKVIPAMLESPLVRIAAVASRTAAKAAEWAALARCDALVGYERLLERADIDAIYMPLPTGLHERWIMRALAAGKHVLVEKSLAADGASARRIVEMARARGLLVMEHFMFLYHSQHAAVRELIARGEIGEVRLFKSAFGFPPLDHGNFRYSAELGGGALLDAGAYTVRAAQLFLGAELQVLGATLAEDATLGVDIGGAALLANRQGQAAQLAFGFNHFYQCNYELWGSRGKLVLERAFTPPTSLAPIVCIERQGQRVELPLPPDDHFCNSVAHFAQTILAGHSFCAHWDAVARQAALLDAIRSQAARAFAGDSQTCQQRHSAPVAAAVGRA